MSQHSAPAQHYDHVTGAWRHLLGDDLHYGYFQHPQDDLTKATSNLTAKMAKEAQVKPAQEVLDVGCGVGSPAIWLASKLGCYVTGISTSNVGLLEARHQAAERGVRDRVQFQFGDGMCNGLPEDRFDLVWVMESSHLMSNKGALLAESARVLRRGGRLALCDVILPRPMPLVHLLKHAREFLLLERVYGEAKMETLDTYRESAEQAGLTIEAVQDISEATRPTFAHWRMNAYANREKVIELIGQDCFEDFVASCDVLERFWEQRCLGYGLLTAVKGGACHAAT